jgi:O-antigen/teichoic acid export membrane protein
MGTETDSESQGLQDAFLTVASGGALVFGSKVVALSFGFFTQILMARLLTETEYGQVVLVFAVVTIAEIVARLGMDDGVMQEFPRYEDSPAKARGVVRASLGTGVVTGLIMGAALFFFPGTRHVGVSTTLAHSTVPCRSSRCSVPRCK